MTLKMLDSLGCPTWKTFLRDGVDEHKAVDDDEDDYMGVGDPTPSWKCFEPLNLPLFV